MTVQHNLSGDILWVPELRPYLQNLEVYWCPSGPRAAMWDGVPFKHSTRLFTYGLNAWGWRESLNPADPVNFNRGIGGMDRSWDDNIWRKKIGCIKNASEMIAFLDSNCVGIWDSTVDPLLDVNIGEGPGYRHRMGANVVFADGHSEWYKVDYLVGTMYYDINTKQVIVSNPKGLERMWDDDNLDSNQ